MSMTEKDREEALSIARDILTGPHRLSKTLIAEQIFDYGKRIRTEAAREERERCATFDEIKEWLINKSSQYKTEYIQAAIVMLREMFSTCRSILTPDSAIDLKTCRACISSDYDCGGEDCPIGAHNAATRRKAVDNKCTLTNKELGEKLIEWAIKLAKSGGREWSLRIPADSNYDPDILMCEVSDRIATLESQICAKDKRIADLEKECATPILVNTTRLVEQLSEERAKVERLREALSKYGKHTIECASSRCTIAPCNCGFSKSLAATEPISPSSPEGGVDSKA